MNTLTKVKAVIIVDFKKMVGQEEIKEDFCPFILQVNC